MAITPLPAVGLLLEQPCSGSSWSCTASHLLHWLYTLAIILTVILVLVSGLAIRLWRKSKDSDDPR